MAWWNRFSRVLRTNKRLVLLAVLLLLSVTSIFSQARNGRVISAENGIWLNGVEILNEQGVRISSTDQNGEFDIPEEGEYYLIRKGFKPKTAFLDPEAYLIITLEDEPQNLLEVQVKMDNFQSRLQTVSSSISILDATDIQSNNELNFAPILQMTPGVYMHNGTLTTNRITIRGIGSRNLFGTSKIRAYYQDIPLTNGSGETSIEDLELSTISRMEIRKGPSSSQFGAGLGGTILMIPDKGNFGEYSTNATWTTGSFGLQRFMANAKLGNKKNSALISFTDTHSDGYRDNNETDRQNLTLASNHYLNEKNNLVAIANFTHLKAFIPSSISWQDYQEDPRKAAFTWESAKGNEDYDKMLLGLSWDHQFNDKSRQITSIFGTYYNADEDRPFNILEEKSFAVGARSRFQSESSLFNKALKWTAGIEFFLDELDYQTFENLYAQFPPGTGSVKGALLTDLTEKRYYFNFFADSKLQLNSRWSLDLGLNVNQTNYNLDDQLQKGQDLSGSYSFDTMFSPKLGTTYAFKESSMAYASISHGFSPPKLEETLLPEGSINPDIRPETGWNFELGSRGKFLKEKIEYDLALYYMPVKDLLVARRTGDDQFIGVNAGKTSLKGIEIALSYYLLNRKEFQISHINVLNWSDHVFEDFVDLDNDYSGNDLTGIPKHTFQSQLYFQWHKGFYANFSYYNSGRIPVNDANSVYSESYQLVNAKVGWQGNFGNAWRIHLFGGLNNVFDEKYASMLQINAPSFGNREPRYYYPGEPINYYLGMNLGYTF